MQRIVSGVPQAKPRPATSRRGTPDTIYWTEPRGSPRLWGFKRGTPPPRGHIREAIVVRCHRVADGVTSASLRRYLRTVDPRGPGRETRPGRRGILGHPPRVVSTTAIPRVVLPRAG